MFNYINYFYELIKSGSFFWFCALTGSGMFIIQFIINIFGISDHESFDTGDVASDNVDDVNSDYADAKKFKWLSLQTITGFLMVFGWTAITCQNEFGLHNHTTIVISLSAGIFAALIIRSVFKLANKLRSSGSVFKIEEAVGKEAHVYQRIPKDGVGKISIILNDFTHEIDAISHENKELPSFIRVKIIEKSDNKTVVVKPL